MNSIFDRLGVDLRINVDRFIGRKVQITLYYHPDKEVCTVHHGTLEQITRCVSDESGVCVSLHLRIGSDWDHPIFTEGMTGTIRMVS